jgi:uracil DNA glycosylase
MMSDWKDLFDAVKEKELFENSAFFFAEEYQNYTIYPPRDMVYQAFKLTKPSRI